MGARFNVFVCVVCVLLCNVVWCLLVVWCVCVLLCVRCLDAVFVHYCVMVRVAISLWCFVIVCLINVRGCCVSDLLDDVV